MWIILLFSLMASAQDKKFCGQKQIDESCKFLQENSSKQSFTLSDGFEWKNPFYMEPVKSAESKKPTLQSAKLNIGLGFGMNADEMLKRSLEKQIEISKILAEVEKTVKLSDRFKMAFMQNGLAAFSPSFSNTVLLPIPIDDENAQLQSISKAKAIELISVFPKAQLDTLKKMAETMSLGYGMGAGMGADEAKDKTTQLQMRMASNRRQHVSNLLHQLMSLENANSKKESEEVVKNKERVQTLFESVKKDLIQSITKGLPEEKWSAEQRSVVERIRTVKLGEPRSCVAKSLNAGYSPHRHQLSLCPAYYSEPDINIVGVLGHEIGHSIDPCRTGSTLVSKNGKFELIGFEDDSVARWPTVSPVIQRENHPLYEVENCLVKNMGIRRIEEIDLEIESSRNARYLQVEKKLSDKEREERRVSLLKRMIGKKDCVSINGIESEINEAMSDVYRAIAMSSYLKRSPLKNNIDRMAASSRFAAAVCVDKKDDKSVNDEGEEVNLMEEHPLSSSRWEKFILQIPEISKAYGCSRNPQYICYDEFISGKSQVDAVRSQATEGVR